MGAKNVDFLFNSKGYIEELDVEGEPDPFEASANTEAEPNGPVPSVLNMLSLLSGHDSTGGSWALGTLVGSELIPEPPIPEAEDKALIIAATTLIVVRVDSGTKGV